MRRHTAREQRRPQGSALQDDTLADGVPDRHPSALRLAPGPLESHRPTTYFFWPFVERAWLGVHEMEPTLHLGIAFLRVKWMDEALASFEQALAHATDAARQQRLTVQLARMHLEGGRPGQAKGVRIGGRKRLPDDMHLLSLPKS